MNDPLASTLMIDVQHCARCDGDHEQVRFTLLNRAVEDSDGTAWQYWAPCPVNGEPILLTTSAPPEQQGIAQS